MMTTGQGASQATWLLTEPAPLAEAAAAPRTQDQQIAVPGAEESGGGRARNHLDSDRQRRPGLAAEDGERGVPRRSLAEGPLEGPP